MDLRESQEIKGVLCSHEDMIQSNMTFIFTITSKVHDNGRRIISKIALVMGTLVQLKQKISILEVECDVIRNLVVNLCKDAQSRASSYRLSTNSGHGVPKEEDIVHGLLGNMEIGEQESIPTKLGLEEAIRHHIFC